jgi:hypothetical protein
MSALMDQFRALRDAYSDFYRSNVLGEVPAPADREVAQENLNQHYLYQMNAIEQEIFGGVDPARSRDLVETILDAMREMARTPDEEGFSESDLEILVYAKFHQHFEDLDEPPGRDRTLKLIEAAKRRSEEEKFVSPAYVREYIQQVIGCYADAFEFIPHDTRAVQHTDGPWVNTRGGRTPLICEPGDEATV